MTFDEFCVMFGVTVKLVQKANDTHWHSELLDVFYLNAKEGDLIQVQAKALTARKSLRELCKILTRERCVQIRGRYIKLPEISL